MKLNKLSFLSAVTLTVGLTAATAFSAEMPAMAGMAATAGEEEITFGQLGKAADVTRTITVHMQDLAYDMKKLDVKNGETIRFILINKDETEHEFTMGTAEMNAADREKMAKMFDMGQDMSMAGEDNAITIAALQTKEIIWTFSGPSQIEFACNIPGHYESGMKGEIIVAK